MFIMSYLITPGESSWASYKGLVEGWGGGKGEVQVRNISLYVTGLASVLLSVVKNILRMKFYDFLVFKLKIAPISQNLHSLHVITLLEVLY